MDTKQTVKIGGAGTILAVLAFAAVDAPQALKQWFGMELYWDGGFIVEYGKRVDEPQSGSATPNNLASSGTEQQLAPAAVAADNLMVEIGETSLSDRRSARAAEKGQACGSAIEELRAVLEKQCERIGVEQGALSVKLEPKNDKCQTCTVVANQWQCMAYTEAKCTFMGALND